MKWLIYSIYLEFHISPSTLSTSGHGATIIRYCRIKWFRYPIDNHNMYPRSLLLYLPCDGVCEWKLVGMQIITALARNNIQWFLVAPISNKPITCKLIRLLSKASYQWNKMNKIELAHHLDLFDSLPLTLRSSHWASHQRCKVYHLFKHQLNTHTLLIY